MIAPRPTAGCVAPPAKSSGPPPYRKMHVPVGSINHTRTEALKAAKGGNPAAD